MRFRSILALIGSNRSLVLLDQAVYSGSSLLLTLSLARLLPAGTFGEFSAIVLITYLLVSILNAVVVAPFQVSHATVENSLDYRAFLFSWNLILIGLLLAGFVSFRFLLQGSVPQIQGLQLGALLFAGSFLLHDFLRKVGLAVDQVRKVLKLDVLAAFGQFIVLCYSYWQPEVALNRLLFLLGFAYFPAMAFGIFKGKYEFQLARQWRFYLKLHLDQGKWLLTTSILQWWSSNLFVIASGAFLGLAALGAFRIVQSIFGVLNLLLQTFENYVLPKASVLYVASPQKAKAYILQVSKTAGVLFLVILTLLFCFSDQVILLVGGAKYATYGYVVQGMSLLYALIFLGYPVRLAIRLLVLNRDIFVGYAIVLIFSLCTYSYLLSNWSLIGALVGLACSQLLLLLYWQNILHRNNFYLWK